MSGGFEPFHDFFAPPGRQMRILRPIVQPLVLAMLEIHAHSRSGGSIGTELVGNHHPWRARLPADEFAQELFRRAAIPAALNQSVENKAICVDGAPKPMLLAVDGDHDFVEMPFVAEPWGATADLVGVDPPEFLRPAPHGFVADDDPARRQQVLDHSQAERKPEIQPNRLLDDLGRKPMAAINGFQRRVHRPQIATNRRKVANLTMPTGQVKLPAFDDDVWELYDTTTDWTQSKNLAKKHPDKLHALQRLWLIEAVKYNVLPLDDRFAERANPDLAGRPQLIKGNRQILFRGMGRLTESSIVNTKNKSHALTAEVIVPPTGAEGVIVALGGIIGGWSLYAKGGKLKYCYNFYGVNRYTIEGASAIPPGTHQVRMEFKYDGGGLAKGGAVTLYVDGGKVGEGRVEMTEPMVLSADETCDVGDEFGSPVTYDYPTPKKFSG